MKFKVAGAIVAAGVLVGGSVLAQTTPKVYAYLTPNVYNKKWAEDHLREVTRQRVVTTNALVAVTGVLLGAPTLSGNNRDNIAGHGVKEVKNPAKDLVVEMKKVATEIVTANPSLVPAGTDLSLSMSRYGYSLIYTSKGEDAPYFVEFDCYTYASTDGPLKGGYFKTDPDLTSYGGHECKFASEPRPLAEWQADNYAAVTALHDQVIKKCTDDLR